MKITKKNLQKDAAALLLGGCFFGMAYHLFLTPGQIIIGGFTGIATLLHLLFEWHSGLLLFLLNLPLLILHLFVSGVSFFVRALIGIAVTSLAVEYLTFFPVSVFDPLLCAALGGVVMGIGCGILFVRGFTTGGSDLIVWLIRKKRPQFSSGRLILVVDAVIVIGSALILRNFQTLFYALIAIFCFSRAIDVVTGGAKKAKLAIVSSLCSQEISQSILKELGRGVTSLCAKGDFTQTQRQVLLCVVRPEEVYPLRSLILQTDPCAFFFFAEVDFVVGKGFETEFL